MEKEFLVGIIYSMKSKFLSIIMTILSVTWHVEDRVRDKEVTCVRGCYSLRGIENDGTLFVTNDRDLKKIKEIEVIVLEEYL